MAGRERLIEAGFEALVDEGTGFATESVIQRAGVSKGLLFHHFGTREGLLDAMAARTLAETQAGLDSLADEYPNPRERLVALARTLLEDPRSPAVEVRRVHAFWLLDDASGRCRGTLRDALLADFVAATVADGTATGALRAGTDARAVADMLLARWHGMTTLVAAARVIDFDQAADRLVNDLASIAFP